MDGIEKITGRIVQDLQLELDELAAETRQQAAEIAATFQASAKKEEAELLAKGRLVADQREERLVSVAQLEGRKKILEVKQEMIAKAFEQALDTLVNLPEEQTIALLSQLAVSASRSGKESVILSKRDRSRYGKAAVTAANETLGAGAMLTLDEETRDMAGGLILKDSDVEANCSFEVLIDLQKERLTMDVAKTLFG